MPLSNDTAEVAQFMTEAIAWLDDQQCVERYAYFGTAAGYTSLLDNGGPPLSALGKSYAFTPTSGGSGGDEGLQSTDECDDGEELLSLL